MNQMVKLIEQMNEDISGLKKYSEIEGSELGEYCNHLISTAQYHPYMGREFLIAISKEIKWHLLYFEANCTIVEIEIPSIPQTYKDLEWKEK